VNPRSSHGSSNQRSLTYAIGVAISPVPIIAVILMLFTAKARVNGSMFALGWALALAIVSGVVYFTSDAADAATNSTTVDTISWGQILFGVLLLLLLAARQWRSRPKPGDEPTMPKWMAGIDTFTPAKAFGLAVLLAGVNPKNLLLAAGAGSALAELGPSTTDAVVALIVFVVLGTATIAGPVIYYLTSGEKAKTQLDSAKSSRHSVERLCGSLPRSPTRKAPANRTSALPALARR
jgi:threonine/homoserine/homoserine lactone efflux protein